MSSVRYTRLLLLLGGTFLIYGNSLQGTFHYDDFHSIVDNPHIRKVGNIPAFFLDPGLFSGDAAKAMYRPVLLFSYALNYAIGQYGVLGYHILNVALHAANACLVWWLVQLLGAPRRQALWASWLFALHPICTEPVNYISSRSDSLAALFFMLSLCLFFYGVRRPSVIVLACSWGSFGLGLLSKSTAITLLALLLLADYLLLTGRKWGEYKANLARRHGPYWVVAALYILLITSNDFLTRSLGEPVRDVWVQFLSQTNALVYYSALLIVPANLNVEHQFFEQKLLLSMPVMVALALLLSLLLPLVFLYKKKRDRALFLCFWIVVTLLPVLVIPLNVLVNERRLYLPSVAFCMALSAVICSPQLAGLRLGGRQLGKVVGIVILFLYGSLVLARNKVWSDDLSLWKDALAKSPAMPRVHVHLGNAWITAGDPQRASDAFIAALTLNPEHRAARTNLANIYYEAAARGADKSQVRTYYEEAERHYEKVVAIDSTYVEALNGMGNARRMLGDAQGAAWAYQSAIAVQPHFAQAHFNLASLMLEVGDYSSAAVAYQRVLELGADAGAHAGLGEVYFRQGKLAAAAKSFEWASKLEPGLPDHFYNWGVVLLRQGETSKDALQRRALWRQARTAFEKAVFLHPGYKQVDLLLANLAAEQL